MVIAVSLAFTGRSQEMPRHVFCSGGGSYQAAAIHASWTIGQAEPLATHYQPTVILGSGFQQFDDQPVSVREINRENVFLVYPNPCIDRVYLSADLENPAAVTLIIYDFSGKAVLNKSLPEQRTCREIIELGDLSPGMYNLMILQQSETEKRIESIKLIRK